MRGSFSDLNLSKDISDIDSLLNELDSEGVDYYGEDYEPEDDDGKLLLSNLNNTDLTEYDLRNRDFDRVSFKGSNLAFCELYNSSFNYAKLDNADLSHCVTDNTSFKKAKLRGANLTGAHFKNCDLSGADLTDAIIDDADFSSAKLIGTKMPKNFFALKSGNCTCYIYKDMMTIGRHRYHIKQWLDFTNKDLESFDKSVINAWVNVRGFIESAFSYGVDSHWGFDAG